MPIRALPVLAVTVLAVLTACSDDPSSDLGGPGPTSQPDTVTASPSASTEATPSLRASRPRVVRTVARGLEVPWGVAFLPDGGALVSERDSGRVLLVGDGSPREVGTLDPAEQGEAGLLGLAVSPAFETDRLLFAYLTTASDNRVVRMTYDGQRLGPPEPILTGIPTGFIHDGGRLAFGPDGLLYVSTGEIGEEQLAQDRDSLAGKILRVTPDGEPAPGNPVEDSPVWTMGHRNVQGLAFDDRDRLWATEFGQDTWDELNRISKGSNYGWPLVEGRGGEDRFSDPFVQWNPAEASPSGLAFAGGSLWAGALKGGRLWEVPLRTNGVGDPRGWFVGEFGRVRTVVVAPNGNLWITTSNRDGRGDPAESDDRILEVAVP